MPGLKQDDVRRLMKLAKNAEETEEVLAAYAFSKQLKGHEPMKVYRSLFLLSLYLRALAAEPPVQLSPSTFPRLMAAALGSVPITRIVTPTTTLGIEAWNQARRLSVRAMKRVTSTDSVLSAMSEGSEGFDERSRGDIGSGAWTVYHPIKPPAYSHEPAGYVDRYEPEGQRRVVQNEHPVDLPMYFS